MMLSKSLCLLLTPESQELAKAELETCAHLRSEKVDRVYYAMASHEDALERVKKEGDLITQAKRHHEAQLKALKGLLNYLRRVLPQDSNKITGRNYQFTLLKRRNSLSRSPRTRSFGTLKKDQIIALKKQSPRPSELCYVQCQEKFLTKEQNLNQPLKSSLTSMPYAAPIKKVDTSHTVSRSSKNTVSAPSGSLESQEWTWYHPSIQDSFYQKIPAPIDVEDARIKMSCHEHAIKDFDLQLEMNGLQLEMLKDGGELMPYNIDEYDDLEQKKLKLLVGKRFHQNASNAYWYWLQREKAAK
jgi:hypothetical protein